MTSAAAPQKVAGLIPEFYQDLIGRVSPGVALLILLAIDMRAFDSGGPLPIDKFLSSGIGPSTALVLLAIAAAYSLGIPLTVLGYRMQTIFLPHSWGKFLSETKSACDFFDQQFEIVPEAKGLNPRLHIKHYIKHCKNIGHYRKLHTQISEFLKASDDYAKFILPKLSAESALCTNMAVAIVIWLVFSVLTTGATVEWLSREPSAAYRSAAVAVVLTLFVWSAKRRYEHLLRRQFAMLNNVRNRPREESKGSQDGA